MIGTTDDRPEMQDIPIGLNANGFCLEFDGIDEIEVPASRDWVRRPKGR